MKQYKCRYYKQCDILSNCLCSVSLTSRSLYSAAHFTVSWIRIVLPRKTTVYNFKGILLFHRHSDSLSQLDVSQKTLLTVKLTFNSFLREITCTCPCFHDFPVLVSVSDQSEHCYMVLYFSFGSCTVGRQNGCATHVAHHSAHQKGQRCHPSMLWGR